MLLSSLLNVFCKRYMCINTKFIKFYIIRDHGSLRKMGSYPLTVICIFETMWIIPNVILIYWSINIFICLHNTFVFTIIYQCDLPMLTIFDIKSWLLIDFCFNECQIFGIFLFCGGWLRFVIVLFCMFVRVFTSIPVIRFTLIMFSINIYFMHLWLNE